MQTLRKLIFAALALFLMGCRSDIASETHIAVATNFYATALELETVFEAQSGHQISVTSGSTGQIYAQIINGAPFDVFLSADQDRPAKLISEELASNTFTYAHGRLVLWAPRLNHVDHAILQRGDYMHLALANPDLAPYGRAAQDVIKDMLLGDKIVMGENVGQSFSLIKTGNADMGFAALSQIKALGEDLSGSYWIVPQELYARIAQDAVLLKRGVDKSGARAFLKFLKSGMARDIIENAGYELSYDD